MTELASFQSAIVAGIPATLPDYPADDSTLNQAPARPLILDEGEKRLAVSNALRYVPEEWHPTLAPEFATIFGRN